MPAQLVATIAADGGVQAATRLVERTSRSSGGQALLSRMFDELTSGEHGGKQISATQVAWKDGAVVLDVATPGIGLAALEGCADNAYCFYQHQNFGGRKLTFRDRTAPVTVPVPVAPASEAGATRAFRGVRRTGRGLRRPGPCGSPPSS